MIIASVPYNGELPEDLEFDWELVEIQSTEMKIQLYFHTPSVISLEIPADFLEIRFWDQSLFQARNG